MATDLYETLGIPQSATPEQVRKAYKKRALETHPDRLGPGVSSADKAQSEELFRKVNNAYEVLRDPQNRRIYDQNGIWPPPDSPPMPRPSHGHRPHGQHYHSSRNNFYDPWGGHHLPFMFTDPFALFDSIFDDIHPSRSSHYHRHHHERPWFAAELSRLMSDDFGFPHHGFGGFMDFPFGRGMLPASQPPPSFGGNNGGQWSAESFTSTTINGVTQTSHRRRDWNGDEHVTHTYADGRQVHKVNGVEQPHDQLLPPPGYSRNIPAGQSNSQPMIADHPYETGGGYNEPRRDQVEPRDPHRRWWW